ncbi:DUF202 domain-containing protein [Qaidamihabitans albus]|uniref:DUF202 domain-containing protein n=1 Tax=Qaidamihabitans albus TaxID=2795733 RepID=UPI0018F11B1A|nr:DUF202 domain-containing protein [Qaidamihabitans albus]
MSEGLQPERTGLAWQRTALAAAACALVLVHTAARGGWGALTVPAVLVGTSALVLAVAGGLRERRLRHEAEPGVAGAAVCAWVAFLVAAAAAASLWVILR